MSESQFDRIGGNYYEVRGGHVHRYYTEQKVKVLKEFVVDRDECLDVGCGVGLHANLLMELTGCRVMGLDYSQTMATSANKNLGQGFAVTASATDIPFKDGAFDVSYTINVTHHLINPEAVEKALVEMARVSRSKVFVFEFNPLNPFCKYILFHICPYDTGVERIPSRKEMVAVAKKAGLTIREIRHMSYMPILCPRFLIQPISKIEPVLEKLFPWFTVGIVYILEKQASDSR
jgi:ubiquinone/menaquinone biosynthesis C-methylase UbiE